jgi:hypothetical protein
LAEVSVRCDREAVSNGQARALEGQTHDMVLAALGRVLLEFFAD